MGISWLYCSQRPGADLALLNMPITFLLFLLFVFCALIGPLAILSVAWAMCSPRWRQWGFYSAKFGLIFALLFCVAAEFVRIVLANGAERSAFSVAMASSAGFTMGIIGAYLWKKTKRSLKTVHAGDT